MAEAKSLEDLMRIRAHNRDFLDHVYGNLGTAVGFKKRTGEPLSKEPAIIVFVQFKVNPKWLPEDQRIPERLVGPDGLRCAVDVVEGGKAETEEKVPRAEEEYAERLRGWDDQVWAGSQIAYLDQENFINIGTLGAFARSRNDGTLGFLTNQHVGIEPGQQLFHPVPWGTHLGTTQRTIEFVADENWYGPLIDEPATFVRVDCAFVRLTAGFNLSDINTNLLMREDQLSHEGQLGPVKNISLDDMSIIGQKVLRVGRTTGLRRGTIVAFGYEYKEGMDRYTRYTDLLIIGDDGIPFSTHGDSGSLIVMDNEDLNPIGLLWGGWQEKLRTGHAQEKWTWGSSLSRVLDALEIDLVTSL